MSRRLTVIEERLLVERIARELAWYGYSESDKGNYRARAKAIVAGLMGDTIHAATLKRAVDRLIDAGLRNEGVA